MFKLKPGEKIEYEIRRHWFVMLPKVAGAVAAAVLPPLALILLAWLQNSTEQDQLIKLDATMWWLLIFCYLLWLLLIIVYLFKAWTLYYLDVWYITNGRLIDVNQKGIFRRETKSLRFERIQDVTVIVKGFLATILKFGTVHVQTAGVARRIDILQAKDPYELRRIVLDAHEKALQRRRRKKGYNNIDDEELGLENRFADSQEEDSELEEGNDQYDQGRQPDQTA